MFLVILIAAAIWGIGRAMKAPKSQRWIMIGVLYVAVVVINLTLPVGAPLREATGGEASLWLILGGFAALVLAYRWGLRRLRARIAPPADMSQPKGTFTETELDRYARHIVLREIGGAGQKSLKNARVLVVGAGGLGSPVLQYLAAAGVGTIGVIDDDVVDNSNLQRQVIHTDERMGMPKVFSAQAAMLAQNPYVTVLPYHRKLDEAIAEELMTEYDIVLDGSDNFDTRYLVNRIASQARTPLVSGALSQWEGQLSVFDPAHGSPCYECVFPERPAAGLAPSCSEAGVVCTLPGIVGTMMANEAIKIITGAGAPLRGEMLIYDALYSETRRVALKPRTGCPVCGAGALSA